MRYGDVSFPLWTLWNLGLFKAFGASATAFHLGNLLLYAIVVVEVFVLAAGFVSASRAIPTPSFGSAPRSSRRRIIASSSF